MPRDKCQRQEVWKIGGEVCVCVCGGGVRGLSWRAEQKERMGNNLFLSFFSQQGQSDRARSHWIPSPDRDSVLFSSSSRRNTHTHTLWLCRRICCPCAARCRLSAPPPEGSFKFPATAPKSSTFPPPFPATKHLKLPPDWQEGSGKRFFFSFLFSSGGDQTLTQPRCQKAGKSCPWCKSSKLTIYTFNDSMDVTVKQCQCGCHSEKSVTVDVAVKTVSVWSEQNWCYSEKPRAVSHLLLWPVKKPDWSSLKETNRRFFQSPSKSVFLAFALLQTFFFFFFGWLLPRRLSEFNAVNLQHVPPNSLD